MSEVARELEDPTPAWRSWPSVRLAMIRGAVYAPAIVLVTREPSTFVIAWVPSLLALFEAWAAPRARSERDARFIVSAAFLIASVAFVAAFFQAFYVHALIRTRSFASALIELEAAPGESLTDPSGKNIPSCIGIVYFAQCGGLALATSLGARPPRSGAIYLGLVGIVLVSPLLDWVAFAALTNPSLTDFSAVMAGVGLSLASSFMLAIGGGIAALAVEVLRVFAAKLDRLFAAPERTA